VDQVLALFEVCLFVCEKYLEKQKEVCVAFMDFERCMSVL
jgi:hypothetical protein